MDDMITKSIIIPYSQKSLCTVKQRYDNRNCFSDWSRVMTAEGFHNLSRGSYQVYTTQKKHTSNGYMYYLPYTSHFWDHGGVNHTVTIGPYNSSSPTMRCPNWLSNYGKVEEIWSCAIGPHTADLGYPNEDYIFNMLKTSVAGAIKDRSALLSVTYGEREKTYDLLRDILLTTLKATKQFMRGNLKGFAATLGLSKDQKANVDNATNKWLAYRYGLTPTLLDTVGIAEQAAKLSIPKEPMIKVTKTFHTDSSVKSTFVGGAGNNRFYLEDGSLRDWLAYSSYGDTKIKRKYHVSATFKVFGPKVQTLTQWGLTDLLLHAWERQPLSFVANWFVDIGGYLEAMTAYQGLSYVTGGQGASYSENTNWKSSFRTLYGLSVGNNNYESNSRSSRSYRLPITFNDLNNISPVIKRGPSGDQYYDAIALLWTFARGNAGKSLSKLKN